MLLVLHLAYGSFGKDVSQTCSRLARAEQTLARILSTMDNPPPHSPLWGSMIQIPKKPWNDDSQTLVPIVSIRYDSEFRNHPQYSKMIRNRQLRSSRLKLQLVPPVERLEQGYPFVVVYFSRGNLPSPKKGGD